MLNDETTTTECGLKSPVLASPPPMSAIQAAPNDDRAVGISPFWIRTSIDMLEEERDNYNILPRKAEIDAYVRDGVPRTEFVIALLCGDYHDALAKADPANRWFLPVYHDYLMTKLDPAIHGTPERVARYALHKSAERRGAA